MSRCGHAQIESSALLPLGERITVSVGKYFRFVATICINEVLILGVLLAAVPPGGGGSLLYA